MICPIGGNGIGKCALAERNTYETWRREVFEEMSIVKEVASTADATLLGLAPEQDYYIVPRKDVPPTIQDQDKLLYLKEVFTATAKPFGDFLVTVPKSVLDRGVPNNIRPGYTSILSYWKISVNEEDWATLSELHERYGNLSNESIGVIISLDEIIQTNRYTCCGHDQIMQKFFKEMRCVGADEYPLLADITCERVHMPLDSYDSYLELYDVVRRPQL